MAYAGFFSQSRGTESAAQFTTTSGCPDDYGHFNWSINIFERFQVNHNNNEKYKKIGRGSADINLHFEWSIIISKNVIA